MLLHNVLLHNICIELGDIGAVGPRMDENEFAQLSRELEVQLQIDDSETHEGKQIRNSIIEQFFTNQ